MNLDVENVRYDPINPSKHWFNAASNGYYVKWTVFVVFFASIVISLQPKRPRMLGAPLHGSKGWWEPSLLLSLRFIYDAYNIIDTGYKKVCFIFGDYFASRHDTDTVHKHQFKDVPFVVRRLDTDIHVLPMKYLDELRLVPRNDLNGKMVHYNVRCELSSYLARIHTGHKILTYSESFSKLAVGFCHSRF